MSAEAEEEVDNARDNAPRVVHQSGAARAGEVSPCATLRPPLAHRLYSHQLHVRAKAKLLRDRLLSGSMIDIYVGPSRRRWTLHRNLLCHHSELLEAELEGGSVAERKEALDLRDYDPAGFELFVKWLYQGRLDDVSELADANQKYDYAVSCYKLYLLCDRFDMPQLKNVAMDQYRKGLNEAELVPDADEIDDIYRHSLAGSAFRKLVTRIAARQIMDPNNERDVETYRKCFTDNPDFAVDLFKAIRSGTGGMLFEDPTDLGNECQYHDHEGGSNCHIKGKGKIKQALKIPTTRNPPHPQQSGNSGPSTRFAQPLPLPHLPPAEIPRQLPPRRARRQADRRTGPLRRHLTSPATSTVRTSPEIALGSPPPPGDWEALMRSGEKREALRRVIKRGVEGKEEVGPELGKSMEMPVEVTIQESHLIRDEHQRNLGGGGRGASERVLEEEMEGGEALVERVQNGNEDGNAHSDEDVRSPRRGLWDWARAGTGRLNILGRIPHPEWGKIDEAAQALPVNSVVSGDGMNGIRDDFSVPSAVATQSDPFVNGDKAVAV